MKKILSIVAIALVAITSAYAQEDNNRDENGAVVRGPYLTNGFWDNWFVSAAGGANFTVSKETKFSFGGPAIDLNIGKWFTPAVGFRFGLHGLNNSFDLKPGHTTLIDNGNGNFEFFQYIHTDLLWNITNTLCGYKETRFWNVVPYVGAGWVGLKDPTYKDREGYDEVNDEWGVAAGVLNNFRISNRLCFCLDFSVLSIRNEVLEVSPWIGENDIFAFMPSITAGLCINLGRTNFNRFSSVLPAPVVSYIEKPVEVIKEVHDTVEVQGPDKLLTVMLDNVTFDFDKDVLTPLSQEVLDTVATVLKNYPNQHFLIAGYTDVRGGFDYNIDLSRRRAKAVYDALIERGVAKSQIYWYGFGKKATTVPYGESHDVRRGDRKVVIERISNMDYWNWLINSGKNN